jgi:hypothetical protein
MLAARLLRRRTRAERVRISFTDAGGGLRLPLASRRTTIPGLAVGLIFLVVASMAVQQLSSRQTLRFDTWVHRGVALLDGLWLLGLCAGAVAVLLLTMALLTYRESARLAERELIHVARLGPVHVFMEYDLDKLRNLRAVETGKVRARVVFDYAGGHHGLGDDLPQAEAEARVKMIQAAIDGLGARRSSQHGAPVARPTPRP